MNSGLATAVIGLGKTFELSVVAEGIEFQEQWSALRALGCELGQGFYFARPIDSSSTVEYLQGCPETLEPPRMLQSNGSHPGDAT